ncbi:hypothetical protein Q0Z83_000250 [Actinoplanes sichuanensis]|nr:hypothetical protein Q0Z83_000250 [Actinoplanes sichuanensis]
MSAAQLSQLPTAHSRAQSDLPQAVTSAKSADGMCRQTKLAIWWRKLRIKIDQWERRHRASCDKRSDRPYAMQ